jgi:RNA polymerase sigma-70 factor (ECF subfamily)
MPPIHPGANMREAIAANKSDELAVLLDLISMGNEQAFARLYRAMNRKVYAFALQFLRNPHLAEEVVTETLFEVWRNARRFAGQSRASTWVLGIARHKALDKVREQEAVERVESAWDETCELIASGDPSVFERLAQRQTASQIQRCLASLPVDQRECIHLVFFQDLSLAEVAALQGVPENTVKTRLFHARRKLRAKLERLLNRPVPIGDIAGRDDETCPNARRGGSRG